MKALKEIFGAVRKLLRHWRVMAVLAAVYAALLASLFLFVATKEATIWQVWLTLIFAALAPALFFLLQAMIVNYARGEVHLLALLRRSFGDSSRLALASLPLALLAVVIVYVLNKFHPAPMAYTAPRQPSLNSIPQLQWSQLIWTTARLLLFSVALPLAAIHLWNAIIRDGLVRGLKSAPHHLARAFAPSAVLIYATGIIFFGLIPYLLLFTRTPAAKPSVEFGIFITRLLLVFLFTLYGWVLTFDALSNVSNVKNQETIGQRQVEAEAV